MKILLKKSLDRLRIGVIDEDFLGGGLLGVAASEHGPEDLRAEGQDRLVCGQALLLTDEGDVGQARAGLAELVQVLCEVFPIVGRSI